VAAAVASARSLAAKRQFADAKQALYAVITPADMEADRTMKRSRQDLFRPTDAELPALKELQSLARDSHDPFLLPEIGPALLIRRELADKSSEQVLWFGTQERGSFHDPSAFKLLHQISFAIEQGEMGRRLALESSHEWSSFGLERGYLLGRDSAKVGSWSLFPLLVSARARKNRVTVSKNAASVDLLIVGEVQLSNCVETNKVDHIDYQTGRVIYRQLCDVKKLKDTHITFHASLAAEPPEWAQGTVLDPDDRAHAGLAVIGKVKKQGWEWVLDDARVVDLHYLGGL
jgi:hypothetical protein